MGSPRTDEPSEASIVRLKLDLASFVDRDFKGYVERAEQNGIEFASLSSLGDGESNRRRLYELNRECSLDIPGRGAFYSYEEYVEVRLEHPSFAPSGTIIAVNEREWIGMSAISDWHLRGFMFNEMTGVRRGHRGRGIATAMKVLGIRFAQSTGARWLYTVHDARNVGAVTMNRRLGYVDADWDPLLL